MRILAHLVTKEVRLLLRDWHALLLLFVMPVAFILIMSLALQNRFSTESGVHIEYLLLNQDSGAVDKRLLHALNKLDGFSALPTSGDATHVHAQLDHGKARFALIVPRGFGTALDSDEPLPLKIAVAPDVSAPLWRLFQSGVRGAVLEVYLDQVLPGGIDEGDDSVSATIDRLVMQRARHSDKAAAALPSSVQQNVPAWLLFAMFFIAIPLSTTWVHERQQGTYTRLRSMGIAPRWLLAGKLVPYLGVNLLQVVLMLLVGVFVVPWLGGEALSLGHSASALVLMALVASFAAVAYALLIANIVSSSEQATIFTGVANLLMAALGGIMVPRFIMPPAMQAISQYSPMAWGLDGFLDIFLRGGGVPMVAGPALKLLAFGTVCLLLAAAFMRQTKG